VNRGVRASSFQASLAVSGVGCYSPDMTYTDESPTIADGTTELPQGDRERPTSRFLDCRTVEEINARWKDVYAEHAEHHGTQFLPMSVINADSEDMRRAFIRTSYRGAKGPVAPRAEIPQANVTEHEDGSLTITCVGTCGETKPVKKFPTNKDGSRAAECRDCRDKRTAESKAAKG
jgi:hypothetical protein